MNKTSPESIAVSLEMAKKLKETGWPQFACWFWTEYTDPVMKKPCDPFLYGSNRDGSCPLLTPPDTHRFFAAPTAEEVLRTLPTSVKARPPKHFTSDRYRIRIGHNTVGAENEKGYKDSWSINLRRSKSPKILPGSTFWDDSLANAAAAMWCYLSEHKLLPLSE